MVDAEAPTLLLRLFGEVRLCEGGKDISPRSRKTRALLAYLSVVPSQSAGRHRLADLLWSDRADEQARGSLRQAIAEVRRCASGSALLFVYRDRVTINPCRITTDLHEIESAAMARNVPELARLMAQLNGGFGDDLNGLAAGYDEWLCIERTHRHEAIIAIVLKAANQTLERADSGDLKMILRGLDQIDPLNEEIARLGMQIDQLVDDRASLHRRFKRLEEGLRREFGAVPSSETRAMFATLTKQGSEDSAGDVAAIALSSERLRARPVAPPTIIVSPMLVETDGPDADLAAICEEDIRIALIQLPDLCVVTLNAPHAGQAESMCAGAVGVYVLSGRLRRLGSILRVNLQLSNLQSNVVIWSEQLRLENADPAATVDRVVERAVGAVLPSINRDLPSRLAQRTGNDRDAALLYTEARLKIKSARTLEAARSGCALLDRVVQIDPCHLGAHLLLARMYHTDFWQMMAGHDVAAFRTFADKHSREAARIDPNNVEVQVRRAWCRLRGGEWRLAQEGFERAVATLPHDADTINPCAAGLCYLGELTQAETLMQRVFRLHPFPPPDYHADYGVVLLLGGRVVEAEEHFEVSGEVGILYLAARLANLSQLGKAGARVADAVRPAFLQGFHAAWQPARTPTTNDVLQWFADTVPVRLATHRQRLYGGLAAVLAEA
ncbi:BTAD domain-containing putative transcriptional regulator [Sphingomonas sp. PB2P19]|uniref:hypothetical protein n=1 Tax=Sphingomonas rhamnosi TaxID=3096156 RepID=UPI002FCC99DD